MLKITPEYRARLDASPPIGRDDIWAHTTYEGTVSLCHRRIDANYSATNKVPCEDCAQARESSPSSRFNEAIATAQYIGTEHGGNAASWVELNTTEQCADILQALADGDPRVYDFLPAPDLSGEMADGYTPRQLVEDVSGLPWLRTTWADDWCTDLCDAYEQAFSEAVESVVSSRCRSLVGGA